MAVTAVIVLALVFGGPVALVALFGRAFLYHPTDTPHAVLNRGGWRVEKVFADTEVMLTGVVRPPPPHREAQDSVVAPPWLLFFGGNAMGLDTAQEVMSLTAGDEPWGLAAFAYRGYDGSGGIPSEEALVADSKVIADFLFREYSVSPSQLVLVGQSLGSGVAAHLASDLAKAGQSPRGLALLSPYASMARLFNEKVPWVPLGWAVPDRYRTDLLVPTLQGPVLLIHGEVDSLIPVSHSRDLAKKLRERVITDLVLIPEAEHNTLWNSAETVVALRRLVRL